MYEWVDNICHCILHYFAMSNTMTICFISSKFSRSVQRNVPCVLVVNNES